jgi:hypothetical protein
VPRRRDLDRKRADAAGSAIDQDLLLGLDISVWRRPWSAVTAAIGTSAASSNDRFAGGVAALASDDHSLQPGTSRWRRLS